MRDRVDRPFRELVARLIENTPIMEPDGTSRTCGECSACCFALEVEPIAKPGGRWCPQCTQPGCAVEATKPALCRAFRCAWHLGFGGLDDRPDRSGWIVDVHTEPPRLTLRVMKWRTWRGTVLPPAWVTPLIADVGAASGEPGAPPMTVEVKPTPTGRWIGVGMSPTATDALEAHGWNVVARL